MGNCDKAGAEKGGAVLTRKQKALLFLGGLAAGFLCGFFGGGGGMAAVPLLTAVLKLENKKAHATALAVMLPLSLIASVFYIANGASDFSLLLPVGLGVVAGGTAGALILKKIKNRYIAKIFYALMIIGGVFMLFSGN